MSTPTTNRPPLVIGEVLFDHFPDGTKILGGAPFNVAWNLHGMGFRPHMISALGQDEAGDQVLQAMDQWGMARDFMQTVVDKPTGEVKVTIENDEPTYDILQDRAWDVIEPPPVIEPQEFSWLYYGSLAYRSSQTAASIEHLIRQTQLPRFVDINIRQPWFDRKWLDVLVRQADWVKMNQDELEWLTDTRCTSEEDIHRAVDRLRGEYQVANFCITSGSKGAYLATENGIGISIAVTQPDPLVDTVGAGDAFASVLLAGLILDRPLKQVGEAASRFAAQVCQINGATCRDKSFYRDILP